MNQWGDLDPFNFKVGLAPTIININNPLSPRYKGHNPDRMPIPYSLYSCQRERCLQL